MQERDEVGKVLHGGVPPMAQCRGQDGGNIKGEDIGLVYGQFQLVYRN